MEVQMEVQMAGSAEGARRGRLRCFVALPGQSDASRAQHPLSNVRSALCGRFGRWGWWRISSLDGRRKS